MLVILVGFTVTSVVGFDLARTFHTDDDKSYMREISWKGWPLFDVLFVVAATIAVAVTASAAGSITGTTLGVPILVALFALPTLTVGVFRPFAPT